MDLRGVVAVVTGASSGIGESTAIALSREGAKVVLAARRDDRLNDLAERIRDHGGEALVVRTDVAEMADLERLRGEVERAHGRIDVLVNNAGIPGGGSFAELSWEQIERVVRVNLVSVMACTKLFLPMFERQGSGHIVNVASLAGRFAVPGASVYTATKHGVVAFSEALSFELRPKGILVTVINPGLVRTESFPHRDRRRVMHPDRIAGAIVKVLRTGKSPEVSIPRTLAAMQAVRVLLPPVYRFGLGQAVKRGLRSTHVNERDAAGPDE